MTGASSGIGLATAGKLARAGLRVVLLSFAADELEAACLSLAGSDCRPCLVDLSLPVQRIDLWRRLEEEHGPLDLLINNAGIGYNTTLLESEDELFRKVHEVNFFAAVDLCRQALPSMAARGRGHIVNLTSASARRGLARMSAYASSKGAMHIFSQTLRLEAAALGVGVSEVLPISVRTNFFAQNVGRPYRPRGLVQTPEHVADCILRAIRDNRAEVCTHSLTGWGLAVEALAPNWVAYWLQKFARPAE